MADLTGDRVMEKKCSKCSELKSLNEYYHNKTNICKDCTRLYVRNYKQKNENYYRDYQKNYMLNPINKARHLLSKCKTRARAKNLPFDLSLRRIAQAFEKGICERTGIQFVLDGPEEGYHRHSFAPSIDKIDPFGGYTNNNVQIVCNAYNFGKGQMTDEEFISFCRKVIEFNNRT